MTTLNNFKVLDQSHFLFRTLNMSHKKNFDRLIQKITYKIKNAKRCEFREIRFIEFKFL